MFCTSILCLETPATYSIITLKMQVIPSVRHWHLLYQYQLLTANSPQSLIVAIVQ